jgi:hypothetical protein
MLDRDRRHEICGCWPAVTGGETHKLNIGVRRHRIKGADRGRRRSPRNTVPTLLDDRSDSGTHDRSLAEQAAISSDGARVAN